MSVFGIKVDGRLSLDSQLIVVFPSSRFVDSDQQRIENKSTSAFIQPSDLQFVLECRLTSIQRITIKMDWVSQRKGF